MSEPLIFWDHYGIKEGRADDFLRDSETIVGVLTSNPTRHLYFAHCINEQGTAYTNIQVHPEAESMVAHMKLVADHIQGAGDTLDFSEGEEDLYGIPNDELREQLAERGTKMNRPVAGYTRLGEPGETASADGPVILMRIYAVDDAGPDDHVTGADEWFDWYRGEQPQVLHYKLYLSEDGARLTTVQVHPDEASVGRQIQLVGDRPGPWHQLPAVESRVVGTVSDALVEGLRGLTGSGDETRVDAPTAGFSRLGAGA